MHINVLIIGNVDVSDYVEKGSPQISVENLLHQITNLDQVTKSAYIRTRRTISATLGLVPDNLIKQIETAIKAAEVSFAVFADTITCTNITLSYGAEMLINDTVVWDAITIQGVEA